MAQSPWLTDTGSPAISGQAPATMPSSNSPPQTPEPADPARAAAPSAEPSLVISYLTLRKAVGAIGITFPWVLSLGCLALSGEGLRESISAYYGTVMHDVFVGLLFAIALFFLSYKGYARDDETAGRLASGFAVGVAVFPTTSATAWIHYAHLGFAAALFLTLSYFSLCLFTRTDPTKTPTAAKKKRNAVYKVCGIVMLACIALAAACMLTPLAAALASIKPVFWLESIALESFGLSWTVKGEAILSDESP